MEKKKNIIFQRIYHAHFHFSSFSPIIDIPDLFVYLFIYLFTIFILTFDFLSFPRPSIGLFYIHSVLYQLDSVRRLLCGENGAVPSPV